MTLLPRLLLLILALSSCAPAVGEGQSFGSFPVFAALVRAYPDRVVWKNPLEGSVITVGGQAFAWAEGRVLPWEERANWNAWSPQAFYTYPREVQNVAAWSRERLEAAEKALAERDAKPVLRSTAFFDALWGIHDRASADAAQRKTTFLGKTVTVHRGIASALAGVEQRLIRAAETDPQVEAFRKNLSRVEGFNWRTIAGTDSRSNHAYGTAVDLIPRSYGGKTAYWLWMDRSEPGWFAPAWKRRWEPPAAVVRAFEAEGFVWGGKWLLFDTIHFEYRPEMALLSGWDPRAEAP